MLYAKNHHMPLPVASTIKIVTAIIALEHAPLNTIIEVDATAAAVAPNVMGLKVGERLTLEALLYGLMLDSGNDAAEAIARGVFGDRARFIRLMNDVVTKLGLQNTHFANPSGLDDPAQHSSAYDLAVLTTYALQNPVFREIVGTRRKVIPASREPGREHGWFGPTNLNRLIGTYPGAFGVKPGWTGDAGFTLVAAAERGGRSLLAVVLGSRNHFTDAERLLNYGFATLHTSTPASMATASTFSVLPCATGGAVISPQDNPGLVEDCTVLLQARDTLSGRATLNWRADLRLFDWDGITISGSPRRVTALELSERQLTGTIPPQLGALSHLERLALSHNQLTGPIPPQLGALTRLQHLDLGFNQLTGAIPPQLGALTALQELWLHVNELTGPIPSQLGTLSQLRELSIGFNQLTGPIPPELGTLTRLEVVGLHVNRLTGPIPPELGLLTKLVRLYLRDNALTGCLSPTLRGVASNDFDKLGLPFCRD